MNLSIQYVETNFVYQVWDKVVPFIMDAMQKGGDFPAESHNYDVEHMRVFLTSGQWLLVVAVDENNEIHGAATVSFLNYPKHRVAFITSIGGKLIANNDTFEQFKNLLKLRGATKIQGYGREAIVRLWKRFNFEPRNTLVEVLI